MAPLTIEMLPAIACPHVPDPMGPGLLMGERGDSQVSFPLQALSMQARLSGPAASVEVRQTFSNPYSEPIEAVYIFPLPAGSAVYKFRMQVKDRIVDGVVQERAQARATYAEGIRQGHRSALLEMERDNVFTAHVGNLPPGESVSIEMTYAQRIEISEAENTFRFPLVVAPRYIPGHELARNPVGEGTAPDTDRVPDASRLTPPLLLPGLKSGAKLSIKVAIETGGLLPARLACSQHAITQSGHGGDLEVELTRTDELLDRDFILRYRLAAQQPHALLLASDKHFMLSLLPPVTSPAPRVGRDIAIVLDRSGSMQGIKMESARKAVAKFLQTLTSNDRFTILAFDNVVESFGSPIWHASAEVYQASLWLDRVDARGGTEIFGALNSALGLPMDSSRLTCVLLITDGQVGNEAEMYRMLQQRNSQARVFTMGIDTAVNDAFLRRVAQLGRGTCELVTPGEAIESSIERLSKEIGNPILTQLVLVDSGFGMVPETITPDVVPDLFAARPVVVLGQHTQGGNLTLQARLANHDFQPWSEVVTAIRTDNAALGVLWARERVTMLEDRLRMEQGLNRQVVEKQILDLALEYQLLTRFTAFVLVDKAETIANADHARTVVQPVQTPAEWSGAPAQVPAAAPMMVKKTGSAPRPDLMRKEGGAGKGQAGPGAARMRGQEPPPLSASLSAGPPSPEFGAAPPMWDAPAPGPWSAPASPASPPPGAAFQMPAPLPPIDAFHAFDAFGASASMVPTDPTSAVVTPLNALSQRWVEVRTGPQPVPADVLVLIEKVLTVLRTLSTASAQASQGADILDALKRQASDAMQRADQWIADLRSWAGLPSLDSWWSQTV